MNGLSMATELVVADRLTIDAEARNTVYLLSHTEAEQYECSYTGYLAISSSVDTLKAIAQAAVLNSQEIHWRHEKIGNRISGDDPNYKELAEYGFYEIDEVKVV